ncbi:MAG TPA: hypothetical protein VGW10_00260 [Solirubrobacteraceae bacterium]|nr:hypothetical protein [Solirubrobacteraceae bacterium]
MVDADVLTTAVDGAGRTYLGGNFTMIGPRTGAAAALTTASDVPQLGFPEVVGDVLVAEPDGAGGWFIGGVFTHVGGVARKNLAHVRADDTVDPAWDPSPNNAVRALLRSGDVLFAGGDFTQIGTRIRSRLAKLTTTGTGGADQAWNPAVDGSSVRTLALSGGSLFVGGSFFEVGGGGGDDLAKISTSGTGAADPAWVPDNLSQRVDAIAVSGTDLFVAGSFVQMGGATRENAAKLPTGGTGTADATWAPNPNGPVTALDVDGGFVFVAGLFFNVKGETRNALAKIPTSGTGAPDADWQPFTDGEVDDLDAADGNVLIVGQFGVTGPIAGFQSRRNVARLSASGAGAVDAWAPQVNGRVLAVSRSGSDLLVGGEFTAAGPELVDVPPLIRLRPDGKLDASWLPRAEGEVRALVLSDTKVFAGGSFVARASGGGIVSAHVARFPATGAGAVAPDAWNPNVDATNVHALALSGDNLFIGGEIFQVGGQPRQNLAKVAADGGGALDAAWDAPVIGPVYALAISGSSLFVGGNIGQIGGVDRENVAKVSTTAPATVDATWDPAPSLPVRALLAFGGDLFVGGDFSAIGGGTRVGVAKLAMTGAGLARDWNPGLNNDVFALSLAPGGGSIYLGGNFTQSNFGGAITPTPYTRVARVPTAGAGEPDPSFRPTPNFNVHSIAASASRVVLGGRFRSVGKTANSGVAHFDLTTPTASIAVPANGATYTVGDSVAASYSCADPDPFVDLTCTGPVASGARIDTATPGTQTFRVDAVDGGGNASSQTVSYIVVEALPAVPPGGTPPPGGIPPGGTPPPLTDVPPVLSGLSVSPASFRAAPRGRPFAAATRVGGRVMYRLSKAARVTFTIVRPKKGKRRARTMGRFAMNGNAGGNRFTLRGRAAGRTLAVGGYRLQARAVDAAGNRSAVARTTFRINR